MSVPNPTEHELLTPDGFTNSGTFCGPNSNRP